MKGMIIHKCSTDQHFAQTYIEADDLRAFCIDMETQIRQFGSLKMVGAVILDYPSRVIGEKAAEYLLGLQNEMKADDAMKSRMDEIMATDIYAIAKYPRGGGNVE